MNWSEEFPDILEHLGSSGLVLLSTDSVWGLCCDALDPVAIHRVLKVKQERPGKGMVCLVSDLPMLKRYVHSIHPRLETVLAYVKRPMTVLYCGVTGFPEVLHGPRGEVAIRIVKDYELSRLIERFGRPIVATLPVCGDTSFNGRFHDIRPDLLDSADYTSLVNRERRNREVSVIVRLDERAELEFVRG